MSIKWQYDDTFKPTGDAYLDWANGPGQKFPPGYENYAVPVTFKLQPGNTIESLIADNNTTFPLFKDQGGGAVPFIPGIYRNRSVFTGLFSPATWQSLMSEYHSDQATRDVLQEVIVGRPLPADALCEESSNSAPASAPQANPKRKKNTVIIGIIDEGIAFASERFRNAPTNSRVEYAWLQDAKCTGGVEGFQYGRELQKDDIVEDGDIATKGIDTLLADCLRGGQVDEDKFYALAGSANHARAGHKAVSWQIAHGTHVMDLAAGFPQGEKPVKPNGKEQDWHIICVQLPTSTVAETSGLGLEKFLLDGVNYIRDRAAKIAEKLDSDELPLVINFSSGVRSGPHDGTSTIEQGLDEFIEKRRLETGAPTQIVLPAGNSYLTRGHARFDLQPAGQSGSEQEVDWVIPPDDKTFSYMEIWLPKDISANDADAVALKITTPAGLESNYLNANASNNHHAMELDIEGSDDDLLCKAYYQFIGGPINRGRYLVALLPTEFHNPPSQLAPSGCWKIVLKNLGNSQTTIDAWIHWDDSPIGYKRFGRQSYFMDNNYTLFDKTTGRAVENDQPASPGGTESLVKRNGTINALATGALPVVVGGYFRKEHSAASYTSADHQGASTKPDFMAVCEATNSMLGILAAGTRSGSTVAMNGTSVAAPQVTRRIAELMAGGSDDNKIKRVLKKEAKKSERKLKRHGNAAHIPPPEIADERKGAGRLSFKLQRDSEQARFIDKLSRTGTAQPVS